MAKIGTVDPFMFFSPDYKKKKMEYDSLFSNITGMLENTKALQTSGSELEGIKSSVQSDVDMDIDRLNKRSGDSYTMSSLFGDMRSPGQVKPKKTYGVARQTLLGA